MTLTLSPRSSRMLALALFFFALWLTSKAVVSAVTLRWGLQNDINQLRQDHSELHKRRLDIRSLERELVALNSSQSVMRAGIVADTERGAAARLQQVARKSVDEANGKLLSVTDLNVGRASSVVSVQVRAHMSETSLPNWMEILENGEPRIDIDDISLTSRGALAGKSAELEAVVTLRTRWRRQEGTNP